jgi:DNA-binding NarL/FixJ family response regulator
MEGSIGRRHPKEASATMVVRVAVADRLPLFRCGVQATLAEAGFQVEAPEDLLKWAQVDEPRLVMLTVAAGDDWALLPELCQVRADTKIIAVLAENDLHTCLRALAAGAVGIVSRDASPQVMREVFDAAVRGTSIVPISVLQALANGATHEAVETRSGRPSHAERNWLRQLAHGDSVAKLATDVGYSERMMFRLLRDLYVKLGVSSRTEAMMKARDEGWL